jgi:DNA (cytosine-5)-methyltransferase 1
LTGEHILAHAPVIDVVAWGSPCQDLSVAGKRAGLEGSRSGLFYEGIRIIKELRKETNNEYPRISIWENVAGALSSNKGADFGVILDEMAEAGALVTEWAVLDAQYFGVPQRRRRVFLISIFDPAIASRCPETILPVAQSVQRNSSSSARQRQEASNQIAVCLRSGGDGGLPSSRGENLIVEPFTLSSHAEYKSGVGSLNVSGGDLGGGSETLIAEVIGSLCHRDYKGVSTQYVKEGKIVLAENQIKPGVRRLTPLECERLMGWPDDWTAGQSDTHRYKQCGNGVASPVATWIGKKISTII